VKTNKRHDCVERRQLEFIQRVGQIGYWEYDPKEQSMSLPQASLDLLASIVGDPLNAPRSFMETLCDIERKHLQSAFDQAAGKRLALNIQLKLSRSDGKHSYVVLRGAPVAVDQGQVGFAGTFQDITKEKQREVDHENVATQLQALLDALPQGVSVIDKDLRLILWNQRFHTILGFPQSLVFRNARFEDFIRLNAMRGEYGPGDPEEQVQVIVARAHEFLPHRFERQLAGGRTVLVEGFPFRSGGEVSGFVTTYTDITDQKRNEEQLTRQRDVMKTIIDNFPGGISLCNTDLKFTAFNDQFKQLLDFPTFLFAKGWVDFEELARFNANRGEYGPGNTEEQVQAVVARAQNFQAHHIERARPNGRWLEIRGTPIPSGGFVTSYIDVTARKQAAQFEQFRSNMLELLAGGDPLSSILEAIVRGVEQLHPAMLCSILLLDSDGKHLGKAVAPSLPDFYNAAIDGIEIGVGAGSCGTTAHTGARVIVENIATHPYWARYKELAASAGLVSCWSQAICSSLGQVLGTFAIYHREANTPTESDIYLIDQSARLASIAIEKSLATEKLRDSETLYRLLAEDVSDVVWKTDRNLRVTYISPADERLRGYSADEVIGHHVFEMFTEEGVAAVTEMIQKSPNAEQRGAQNGFVTFEAQHRCKDGRLLWGEVLSKPECDAHGTIIGYHGITREITERRQLEDLRCEFLVALTSYQEKAPALPVNTHSRVFSH
jgi:PAS domain S-box-containing protein